MQWMQALAMLAFLVVADTKAQLADFGRSKTVVIADNSVEAPLSDKARAEQIVLPPHDNRDLSEIGHQLSPHAIDSKGWLCVGDEVPKRLRRGCGNRYIYQSPQGGDDWPS